MAGMVLGRCTDCDSEYFFMDGSRCAACLSILQDAAEQPYDTEAVCEIPSLPVQEEATRKKAA